MTGASSFTISRDDGRECHGLPLTDGAWSTERVCYVTDAELAEAVP